MSAEAGLERGRAAFDGQQWEGAYRSLREAEGHAPLGPGDLYRLAEAAHMTGRDSDFVAAMDRAHHAYAQAGDAAGAARCAFWIGFFLADRGDTGPARGWLRRAARVLEREGGEYVEHGYLRIAAAHERLGGGDFDGAFEAAAEALAVGERFRDADLIAFALTIEGHARLGQGRTDEGLACLDEAMVAVAGGEVSPVMTGMLYCAVIGACRRVYELGRANEWTAALRDWCRDQPDLVPFRGECLVYRSEILQLRGAWEEALEEARRASEIAGRGEPGAAAGAAAYQQGEVHRLRGEYAAAEEAFRSARRLGRDPLPGLALLRLAQGDAGAATAALRRALAETPDPLRRARLLPARIEIAIAAGDLDEARAASDELESTARRCGAELLDALVCEARGAIALAEDDPLAALSALRRALGAWQALDAPYDAARVRVLLAQACRELGDADTARLELDAARSVFDTLGAAPDVARVDALRDRVGGRRAHGLTARELEVLTLVATGATNRAIAEALFISEKTVARHVSNIFAKLGLSTRAAATAYAYEHELV